MHKTLRAPKISAPSGFGNTPVANDALLVQLVRSALGRAAKTRGLRTNVSSCKFVVTLHGCVREPEERRDIEEVVRRVSGVRGVINRIGVTHSL